MGAWFEFEGDVLEGVCVVLLLGRVLVHLIGFVDKIVSIRTGLAVVALICVGRRNGSRLARFRTMLWSLDHLFCKIF